MDSVRDLVAEAEARSALAPGATERFAGYALMSLPFSSGYVLGLRRFPVTSIGPGYTSVWLRTPAEDWIIYTTVDATVSCPRYFGAALESTSVHRIEVEWTGERTFVVSIGDEVDLRWSVTLAATHDADHVARCQFTASSLLAERTVPLCARRSRRAVSPSRSHRHDGEDSERTAVQSQPATNVDRRRVAGVHSRRGPRHDRTIASADQTR